MALMLARIRIFAYVYAGLAGPTIPLMVLGAAIGGAIPNVPSWNEGYENNSIGGVLAAMLSPAGGFGKFMLVIAALSIIGNMAASLYSISINFQMLLPVLVRVPRAVFSIVAIAVIIPVSIKAADSFFDALENFIGIIAYWSAAFTAIVIVEHVVFRKKNYLSYDHAIWDVRKELPTGIPALAAGIMSFGLVVPSMAQIWYTGPIAEKTGDIGFEMAFAVSAILYVPFRALEIRLRGKL
jgi:purine-cytosine permease-like protein